MATVYGLVYGPQLIGFTDRGIVLRMVLAYSPCAWFAYSPCMVSGTIRNHTDKFFGASPYADHTQEVLTQTIRKPHFDRPYATAPEKSIRGQSDVIVSLGWNH